MSNQRKDILHLILTEINPLKVMALARLEKPQKTTNWKIYKTCDDFMFWAKMFKLTYDIRIILLLRRIQLLWFN